MRTCSLMILAMLTLLAMHTPLLADPGEPAYQRGEQLLAEGDFSGAMAAYASAVRADRDNRDYARRYMLVRRVVQLRHQFENETDNDRLAYLARALRQFYLSHHLHRPALDVDRKVYDRLGDTRSALALADTQLAMGLNEEAAETLAGIPEDSQNTSTRALHAIALSRLGQGDQANRLAGGVNLPKDSGLGVTYAVARMHAATGNRERAVAALKQFFAAVPPSQQAGFRDVVRGCPEFASMATSPAFTAALNTPSKVSESKCSGGKSCAGCPMRGNCPSSQ